MNSIGYYSSFLIPNFKSQKSSDLLLATGLTSLLGLTVAQISQRIYNISLISLSKKNPLTALAALVATVFFVYLIKNILYNPLSNFHQKIKTIEEELNSLKRLNKEISEKLATLSRDTDDRINAISYQNWLSSRSRKANQLKEIENKIRLISCPLSMEEFKQPVVEWLTAVLKVEGDVVPPFRYYITTIFRSINQSLPHCLYSQLTDLVSIKKPDGYYFLSKKKKEKSCKDPDEIIDPQTNQNQHTHYQHLSTMVKIFDNKNQPVNIVAAEIPFEKRTYIAAESPFVEDGASSIEIDRFDLMLKQKKPLIIIDCGDQETTLTPESNYLKPEKRYWNSWEVVDLPEDVINMKKSKAPEVYQNASFFQIDFSCAYYTERAKQLSPEIILSWLKPIIQDPLYQSQEKPLILVQSQTGNYDVGLTIICLEILNRKIEGATEFDVLEIIQHLNAHRFLINIFDCEIIINFAAYLFHPEVKLHLEH